MKTEEGQNLIETALQVSCTLGNLQDFTNDERVNQVLQAARKQLIQAVKEVTK